MTEGTRPYRDGPKQHELKVSFSHLMDALLDGTKTFEVRRDDRDFRVGDVLWLREWGTGGRGYSGRHLKKRVLFIYSADNDLGLGMLDENVVVMALGAMPTYRPEPD